MEGTLKDIQMMSIIDSILQSAGIKSGEMKRVSSIFSRLRMQKHRVFMTFDGPGVLNVALATMDSDKFSLHFLVF